LGSEGGSRSTINGFLGGLVAFMAFYVGWNLPLYLILSILLIIPINLALRPLTFLTFILQLVHALHSTI
jgi:hypothetical protein